MDLTSSWDWFTAFKGYFVKGTQQNKALRWIGWFLVLWTPVLVLFWLLMLVQLDGILAPIHTLVAAARLAIAPGVGGIVIWYVSSKLKWPERNLTPFILLHVAMGAVFAAASAYWFTLPLLEGVRGLPTSTVLRSIVPWQFASNFFLYGLIAGVSYAVRGSWGTRDQRLAAERSDRLRAQAELAALRAHINPHFLFNTLHSVTQLLRAEPERAEVALDRLSELFRYALRLDREHVEVVSLEDEWRFCDSYLWLEQMRMGDRLKVDACLSDDALSCVIPPFTVQPLIENAVRHGLSRKVGTGTITVRAIEQGDTLRIEVSDDGVGAEVSALVDGAGIGVRAVRQRLHARYGDRARVDIDSAVGRGVAITLSIPAESVP